MDNAKIAIFEDDARLQELLGRMIERYGHQVVSHAMTMDQAREIIAGYNEDSIDVAIVDGNLDGGYGGSDGAEVTRLLREKLCDVVIIGHSGGDNVVGVDFSVTKGDDPGKIPAIISSI